MTTSSVVEADLGRPLSVEALLEELYEVSSCGDRSRVPAALDYLLAHVAHWSATDSGQLAALLDRLDPARVVRAVGQTLLAATRLSRLSHSRERRELVARFLVDQRSRGTPASVVERLERGLAVTASREDRGGATTLAYRGPGDAS